MAFSVRNNTKHMADKIKDKNEKVVLLFFNCTHF